MPKTKISEFSATPGNNTDIDGINISEGCAPSGINDAIRELMAQLKDFQAGTAGDSFNGPIGTTTPAAGVFTNLSASGTFALTGDQVQISEGGTGQTTANAAFNALAPSQSTHAGKYLKTDGTNTSWDALDISTADITGTLPVANGGTGVTSSTGTGSVVLSASPTFTGTVNGAALTLSSSLTLSGGTANGVAYLNGSKVLTTGSALTFDGTYFTANGLRLAGADVTNTIYQATGGLGISTGSASGITFSTNLTTRYQIDATGNATWFVGGSRAMDLTSTGLGIGTSSPAYKLDVNGVTRLGAGTPAILAGVGGAFAGGQGELYTIGTNTMGIGTTGAAALRLYTNSTLQATLDSSGNLGLGVTPGGWTTYSALELGKNGGGYIGNTASGGFIGIGNNFYFNGSYRYANNAPASFYYQQSGNHYWNNAVGAASGTAFTFTQAMTLSAGGNLLVGTTTQAASSAGRIVCAEASGGGIQIAHNNSGGGALYVALGGGGVATYTYTGAVGSESYTERARITSGGDLLVGTTSGSFRFVAVSSASDYISRLQNTASSTPQGLSIYYSGASPNGTGSPFLFCEDQTVLRMSVRSNGGIANYQSNNVDLSDARTKKEITPAPSYWDKIGALEIVTYKYNDQTHDDVNVGVIAQQVESVEPVWVDADGFGETPEDGVPLKTVYTKDITFAAIKALQEAMARIEQLEAKVAALEAK